MSRTIAVEVLAPLPPLDADGREWLERWNALGRRLRDLDPARFERALNLAATYVSIYEHPSESEDAFQARLRRIAPRSVPS